MSNQQLILEATQECLARAEKMYNVDLSSVVITFDLKGVCMGQARWREIKSSGRVFNLQLRFNLRMCSEDMNDAINDTVPHEVAHIVCGMVPHLGRNHDAGWKDVCIKLGGTGKTYHTQEVIFGKGKTYAYTASCGKVINLSEQRHKKLLRGVTFRLKSGATITQNSEYKIVGMSGRRVTAAPQQIAAKKPVVLAGPSAPVAPKAYTESKAERVRNVIRKCKAQGEGKDIALAFAVNILGMKPAMARRYVSENWDRA